MGSYEPEHISTWIVGDTDAQPVDKRDTGSHTHTLQLVCMAQTTVTSRFRKGDEKKSLFILTSFYSFARQLFIIWKRMS